MQYLKLIEAALASPPAFAVLYEPRGRDGRGRMHYVALAELAGPPEPTHRTSESGRNLFVVRYKAPAMLFDTAVPREVLGEPIETWLSAYGRGRSRNVATLGRAVRMLSAADLQRILELSGIPAQAHGAYPLLSDYSKPSTVLRERTDMLVAVLKRSTDFRRHVIGAYGDHCAISGFALGPVPIAKSAGLLDAAHVRPVAFDGPDDITNGIALTPTLHRLFDAGFFTLAYEDGLVRIRTSPHLDRSMIQSSETGFQLDLRDGAVARQPADSRAWIHPDQLRFHQDRVFRAT